ncbi:MAG: ammonia-forming cytochrome c nitrite reductase subunit c552, partial [Kiritimatiellae bacterium]|nr:ammonia-forming cytochrome c nitrite reductase subunit c552 [Kiritimatiellia bacterium]
MNSSRPRSGCLRWTRILPLALVAGGVGWLLWREAPKGEQTSFRVDTEQKVAEWRAKSPMPSAEGARCVECHAEIVAMWEKSQHARANRLIADANLAPGTVDFGGVKTRIGEDLSLEQDGLDGFHFEGMPVAVIGIEPLVQPLVETSNGQWQVFNPAYHSQTNGWFNVFPEARHPDEWGHWSKRGMNWNAQCAWCHMTDFRKNHDPETDSYDSEWEAMAISCSQCHGNLSEHAANPDLTPGRRFDQVTAQDNCLSCHARREFLTPERFKAGEDFHGHFRLALLDQPGVYYPDGQVRDENFESGSFLSSKMHDAGVTCFDCHNPHSGGLIAPVENNSLCMSCHTPPGARGAIPIQPELHSHHTAGSTGNRCVECHMPETQYMQSDMRRDHGFTVPDPMLTRTLGIPNACNRCHQDQSVEWAERYSEEWYGDKLAVRRTRPRARAIHEAWEGSETAGAELVRLAKEETNAVWKATLLSLMGPYVREREVREFLQVSLRDQDPLVRSAAIRGLAPYPQFQNLLVYLRHDPHRMVRLDAAWATLERGGLSPDLERELREWLKFNSDQPAGALRLAEA